ncbi:uncharacterized protein LOC116118323 [Pistacia vera]|uniref:uncharacterized protein LOC116118323 n=1 Tax=Pistacia vera TaxID=55513 RepID=UPI00126375D6|nr:uncharacterized protein LOC116118323 [Pistacia vera]
MSEQNPSLPNNTVPAPTQAKTLNTTSHSSQQPQTSENSAKSLWIGDLEPWMVTSLSLQSFNGLKMPKSKKLFKLNWASSKPREKKPVPKPVEQKSMGKNTSKVSSSWADKVRVTKVGSHFTLAAVDLDIKDDILHILDDVIDDNDVEWLRCIVGCFLGYSMPFHAVRSIAFHAWEATGLEDVMSTGTGFYIFRFRDKDAVHSILERGSWMFRGKSIILQQWHAQFTFDKGRISKVLVWARLNGLPYPLWSHKGLCIVSSMLGRLLSSDKTTSERTRLDYGRVCVELDAAKPLRCHIEFQCRISVEAIQIIVEYEWTPKRCPKCYVFGHVCHQPEVPTAAIAQGKNKIVTSFQKAPGKAVQSKNYEPLRQPATIDPIRERERGMERDVLVPSTISVPSTVRVGDASLALVPYQQTVRASRGEFFGFESGSEPDSPFPIKDEQDRIIGFKNCIENTQSFMSSGSRQSTSSNRFASLVLYSDDLQTLDATLSGSVSLPRLAKGIGSWNIKGLNSFSKQRAVRNWISDTSLGLIGLLETKVERSHLQLVVSSVCPSWQFLSNVIDSIACRVLEITYTVTHVSEGFSFGITFVYGSNDPGNCHDLWDFLRDQSVVFGLEGLPWLVLGDFNAILGASDRVGGDPTWYGYMDDFGQCIHDAELIGVPFSWLRYTWHNGQQGDGIILLKRDWVFASLSWFLDRSSTVSEFSPRDVLDHSSIVVWFGPRCGKVPSLFKFLNFWADNVNFRDIVPVVWDEPIVGNPIFRLTQKLGLAKRKLKALHIRVSSHISSRVIEARVWWATAQGNLDQDPFSIECISEERNLANQYFSLCRDEEAFFQQRSHVQWLHLRDWNTRFFHKSLIYRQDLLTASSQPQIAEASRPFSGCISSNMISPLTAPITNDEVRIALFSIPDDKALGPDGFTSLFFKWAWDIIGTDFRDAVKHFFATNEMLRCVNATRIALVPKVESPSRMTGFRPISCCNELLRNYHLGGTSPRCALKVNIWKAFDTGDPFSPYLFVLAMEELADELMVFCRADASSISLIKSVLDYFAKVFGLVTNTEKSQLFLFGVTDEEQIGPLLERILSRIRLWTSASLTYIGQLQLIKSAATVRRIESILASFLWKGTSLSPSGAKVAWSSICYPLMEGGLGIKRIQDWNRAAILKHVWRLLIDRSSIWSSWARLVLLHGWSFWHIRVTSGASWAWRKILLSRVWCQGLIVTCIRDGRDTMLWRDHWLPHSLLCDLLPFRTLTSTGLLWDARVSDIIRDCLWDFPSGSANLQHIWDSITVQPSASYPPRLVWKGHPSGRFFIDSAWNVLRDKQDVNSIHHLLWFPEHIPHPSFILWVASLGQLHTMDRLNSHGVITSSRCDLCRSATETHDHLFFSYDFSSDVWREVTTRMLSTWPTLSWLPLLQ